MLTWVQYNVLNSRDALTRTCRVDEEGAAERKVQDADEKINDQGKPLDDLAYGL